MPINIDKPIANMTNKDGKTMPTNKNSYKSKTVAGLLALFLGSIGIHKFYLGKSGWGIVYILLSWTYVTILVSVIEGITYFAMNGEDFDNKYNIEK